MEKNKIENTKRILAEDMKKYVEVILKEYATVIPEERQEYLKKIDEYYSRIIVEESGTISMFATPRGIIMPKGAYKIFEYMKLIPGYGINKKHTLYKEGEILNTNTYYDYIKHVFVLGMSVEDFFRDSLLHETMHFCGSHGASAIREGLTELKTREVAQRYGLRASRCGYPKEVDVVSRLQKMIGIDITNKITFARSNDEINEILQENCGIEVANLFFEISYVMDNELTTKYDHSKFGGILGPIKKAKAYSQIDYSKIYKKLKKFEEEKVSNTENNKKKFADELKENVPQVKEIQVDLEKENKETEENGINFD